MIFDPDQIYGAMEHASDAALCLSLACEYAEEHRRDRARDEIYSAIDSLKAALEMIDK